VSDDQELIPNEQHTEDGEPRTQSGLDVAEETSERTLVPLQVSQVDFYGDGLMVVLVEIDEERQILIPLHQSCQYLGVNWASQYQRTKRDEILAREMEVVVITTTAGPGQRLFAAAASRDLLAAGSPAWLAVYPQSE
jgi:predicted ribonuclease YlaK